MSGLDPPPGNSFVEADVTLDSGLDPPPGNEAAVAANTARAVPTETQAVPAKATHAATVRVAIQQPRPFSVRIESDEEIRIISVQVSILDSNGTSLFSTPLSIGFRTMQAGQPRTLVPTPQELAGAEPFLKVGNAIQVKVVYVTPPKPAQIRLSITGQN